MELTKISDVELEETNVTRIKKEVLLNEKSYLENELQKINSKLQLFEEVVEPKDI